MNVPVNITELLSAARTGDRAALDRVFSLVYDEVRGLARAQLMRAGGSPTLNTTAVVHEAYLRLANAPRLSLEDRRHFFAVAASAMRHVIVDYARARSAGKRGGNATHLDLDGNDVSIEEDAAAIMDLEWALRRLVEVDQRLARVVELRFYGGFSEQETAEVLGLTDRTIRRDWRAARAFLYRELAAGVIEGEGMPES